MKESWYLLYAGSSVDGMGSPKYAGRTLDKAVAKAHFKKCQNPYSTGKVVIVDDREEKLASQADFK